MSIVAAAVMAVAVWVGFTGPATRRHRVPEETKSATDRLTSTRFRPTIELLSAALDAGLAPASAVSAVAAALPTCSPLHRAAAMLYVTGQPAWHGFVDDAELGRLATVMARSESSGAPVADAIRVLADEVRRAEQAERLIRARRVGVRTAAPLGLCFLPAFFVVAVVPTVIGLLGRVL